MVDNKIHFFLDTSTQINRHWANEETNKKVRADLFGKKLSCSIYVEREYRCKILNTLITTHNILTKFDDIEAAKQRTEKLKLEGIFDDLVYNVIVRLFERFQSKKPIIRRLKNLIKGAWENFFSPEIKIIRSNADRRFKIVPFPDI